MPLAVDPLGIRQSVRPSGWLSLPQLRQSPPHPPPVSITLGVGLQHLCPCRPPSPALTPASWHPLRVGQVWVPAGAPASLSPSHPAPRPPLHPSLQLPASLSPPPVYPERSALGTGGIQLPLLQAGRGAGGGSGPLTWPRPCRPPPHQPSFIKQTGPYIAWPDSQGRLIWLGGSARLWGRHWEGGRRGVALGSVCSPSIRPLRQPQRDPPT